MAIIQSGDSADQLSIGTNKAARVTLYDENGSVIFRSFPAGSGSYMSTINFTTTTSGVGSTHYAFRNPASSGKTIYIRNIRGRCTFSGVPSANTYGIEFNRYSLADFTNGGTSPGRIKKRTSYPASVIADVNFLQKDTVLASSSVAIELPFQSVMIPAHSASIGQFDIDFVSAGQVNEFFELAAGEGMCIRIATGSATHVAGFRVAGSVEWDER